MPQPKDKDWLNGYKNKTPIYVVYKRPTSKQGPLPIGEKRSTTRLEMESLPSPLQRVNFSSGKRGPTLLEEGHGAWSDLSVSQKQIVPGLSHWDLGFYCYCSKAYPMLTNTHGCLEHGKGEIMASLIQWTWNWANSRRWWGTGRPGVLQFMGSQSSWGHKVGHD